MEKQRSFSFKPTRTLVFSFTISSSVVFLTFFTIWLCKFTPSILEETNFEFNKSSLSTVQIFAGLTNNASASSLKNSILINTHFKAPQNTSGFASISVLRVEKNKSEMVKDEREKETVDGNFTSVQERVTVTETSSENIRATASERIEEKKIRAISMEDSEAPRSEKIAVTSFAKSESPTGERSEERQKRATLAAKNVGLSRNDKIKEKSAKECDITKGRWIYDESYPLYTNNSCPFMDEGFDCVGNGRLDKDYMKWRWQPTDCDIPRFNATEMLKLISGKRLVFVGDSINRNQWESMLCMLMAAVKDPKRVYETHGRRITKEKGNYSFRFVDYRCTVEYYVSHFLVHESKARLGQKRVQTLRIDSIDHGSSRWRGADILIFNTAHWWSHFKTKAGINYYQEGNQVHPKLDVSAAFRRALMTWASWVDRHIKAKKTQVFFRSSAPSHFRGGQWNSGGHCKEATLPLNETSSIGYYEKNAITEETIKHMKTPVSFLNITSLSEFRIDGHPSIYGKRIRKHYASSIQDCSHWCLPGIPDTWNELLYFQLQSRRVNSLQ